MANKGTCTYEWQRPSTSAPAGYIRFKWTSTTTGNVILTTTDYLAGRVGRFVTNPGTTAPESNYDITITDEDSLDILNGAGANRHTSTTEVVYPQATGAVAGKTGAVEIPFAGLLTFNVTNASTGLVARRGEATLYYY